MQLLVIESERRALVLDGVEPEVFQVHGRAAHTHAPLTTFKEDGFASAFEISAVWYKRAEPAFVLDRLDHSVFMDTTQFGEDRDLFQEEVGESRVKIALGRCGASGMRK